MCLEHRAQHAEGTGLIMTLLRSERRGQEGLRRRAEGRGGAGCERMLALKIKVMGEGGGKGRVGVNGDSDASFLKT